MVFDRLFDLLSRSEREVLQSLNRHVDLSLDATKPVIKNAESSSIDTTDFSVKNTYLNGFLEFITIIIDPATDSMKYEAHMKKFATSREVPSQFRKFANKMEALRMKKKKS